MLVPLPVLPARAPLPVLAPAPPEPIPASLVSDPCPHGAAAQSSAVVHAINAQFRISTSTDASFRTLASIAAKCPARGRRTRDRFDAPLQLRQRSRAAWHRLAYRPTSRYGHDVPRTYASARDRILDAAERVLVREGLGKLSLDAVLGEAAVSKGGFFHHFATKNELLGALTERLSAHVGRLIERVARRDPEPRGRLLRGHIELAFNMAQPERERLRALVLSLIENSRANPAVVLEVRAADRRALAAHVAEGVSESHALLVQFALDGYWIAESLGTLELSGRQRAGLRRALRELTRAPAPPRRPRGGDAS